MSRPPLPRPALIPGLRRIWRDTRTVQLGAHPARAHLLDLPDPSAAALLDLLDGSRSERVILRRAAALGVPPDDTHALLDGLHRAGLVLPAASLWPTALDDNTRTRLSGEAAAIALQPGEPTRTPASVLRRRRAARVVLAGRSRLAAGLAVALAEAGVGHVHADVPGTVTTHDRIGGPLRDTDLGCLHTEAIPAAVHRAAPSTETRAVRRGNASLVIQFEFDQPVAVLAAGHAQRAQAYLPVTIREAVPIVGPLVRPDSGPCLNCLDLHRQDRETEAARLHSAEEIGADGPGGAHGLGADAARGGRPRVVGSAATGLSEPCAVATLLAATGYVLGEALAFIDGQTPATVGAEVEIGAPGHFRRRSWTPHPACFCTPRRPVPRRPRAGPSVQGGRSAFSRSQ